MKKRIIIVDDEEAVRRVMEKILTAAGYDCITASDGMDAIEKLSRQNVDLILLDMNMPNMNGVEFLKYIRVKNITHAPVLMASGSSDPEQRIESYQLGVYDYIKKPEQNEVLLRRIENGLKIGDMIYFNEFIKVELMMAKKLQKYLYPEPVLRSDKMDLEAWTKPLADVGGDLYDYINFRDGRIIFFVADVSGHSISAALYTAIVKMVFRNAIKEMDTPGKVLTFMNRELAGNIPIESFVTMFCGMYNPSTSTVYYANAGHPAPFFIRGDEISELEGNDPFLGPIPDAEFRTNEKKVNPGDHIFIYTDGVTDSISDQNVPAGKKYLHDKLSAESGSIYDRFRDVTSDISGGRFTVTDDCTIMLVAIR
jgi:CheY-like chemotaxis protein